jgi:hypothetical protein
MDSATARGSRRHGRLAGRGLQAASCLFSGDRCRTSCGARTGRDPISGASFHASSTSMTSAPRCGRHSRNSSPAKRGPLNIHFTTKAIELLRRREMKRGGQSRPSLCWRPQRQNGTLPVTCQVQMCVALPMPPYSPPVVSCTPFGAVAAMPLVTRADQPCNSGVVVRPVAAALSQEK